MTLPGRAAIWGVSGVFTGLFRSRPPLGRGTTELLGAGVPILGVPSPAKDK